MLIPPTSNQEQQGQEPQQEQQTQESQPQQETQAPAEYSTRPGRTDDLGERTLTPEETEALLRGEPAEPGRGVENSVLQREQQRMAQEFLMPSVPNEQQMAQMAEQQFQPQQTPPQQQAQQQVPQQQVQQQQPPQQLQQNPEIQALQTQIQLLQQQNQMLQRQMQQQVQPQPGTQPQPQQQQAQVPKFNFSVPAAYMNALGDENPAVRQQALDGILNGVANSLYAQVQQEIQEAIGSSVPTTVQQQMNQMNQQNQISQDMYGTYPELRQHSNLVYAAAEQLQQQGYGGMGWTPDFRDMVAERLSPMVPGLAAKVQQNRAQRMGVSAYQNQQNPNPQQLPQQQIPQAPPSGMIAGGSHGPQVQQPMLIRDQNGQIVQLVPQQPQGAQTRPNGAGSMVDPGLADIWNTLGYRT